VCEGVSVDEFSRLADEAGFVFKGRVVGRKHAEDEPEADTGPAAVTVEVEEVLHGTDVMRSLVGAEVTVVGTSGAEGETHVFFTDVVSVGAEVVVREIEHREASAGTVRAVVEGTRIASERPLAERVRGADLIVTGRVTGVKDVASDEPISEHDPKWSIARVAIDSVLKGRGSRRTVEVLFASSLDIAWYQSPKLNEGVSGIFILRRRDEEEAPDGVPASVYQATHPLDFLSHDRLRDVQRLIGRDDGAA
jgi:hypothetical protein